MKVQAPLTRSARGRGKNMDVYRWQIRELREQLKTAIDNNAQLSHVIDQQTDSLNNNHMAKGDYTLALMFALPLLEKAASLIQDEGWQQDYKDWKKEYMRKAIQGQPVEK